MLPPPPYWVREAAREVGIRSLNQFLDGVVEPDFPDQLRALPHDALVAMLLVVARARWKENHGQSATT